MQEKRQLTKHVQQKSSTSEIRKQSLRKKYQEDAQFREKKLKSASVRYLDDDAFQANVKLINRKRYHEKSDQYQKQKQENIQ